MIFHTSKHIFAHIDCNSFYASCEVLRDPSLKGKYVAVGDQIVIAASYECKRLGIKVGTPIWETRRILGKKLIMKPPDHAWYRQVSDRMMGYLSGRFWKIEVFSIDELFVEVTWFASDYAEFAETIKKEIYHDIGIPVSIGISNTRLRAKMFGDLRKPFGSLVEFDTKEVESILQSLQVTEIPYIARGNSERLGPIIKTAYDFYNMEGRQVSKILGRNGCVLWLELHGVDAWTPHDTNLKRKSIVCSRSFNHEMNGNIHFLWRQILMNFERGYETMLSEKQWSRVIGILLRTKEFTYQSASTDLGEVNIDRVGMIESLRNLLKKLYTVGVTYRTTGVSFSQLSTFTPKQLSLFDIPDRTHEKNLRVSSAISKLKERFGDSVISQGIIKKREKQELGVLFEVK